MKLIKDPGAGITALPCFPAVLVTVGKNIISVAAFSFCSFEPPMLMIGLKPRNYSYELLIKGEDFGVNIPGYTQADLVSYCGSVSGRDTDKYTRAGITPLKPQRIKSLLIKECPVNIECTKLSRIDTGGSHIWFTGKIEAVFMEEDYNAEDALMFWLGRYRRVGSIIEKPVL